MKQNHPSIEYTEGLLERKYFQLFPLLKLELEKLKYPKKFLNNFIRAYLEYDGLRELLFMWVTEEDEDTKKEIFKDVYEQVTQIVFYNKDFDLTRQEWQVIQELREIKRVLTTVKGGFGFSRKDLFNVLGVHRPRKLTGKDLFSKRAYDLIELYTRISSFFVNKKDIILWLNTPSIDMELRTPKELLLDREDYLPFLLEYVSMMMNP